MLQRLPIILAQVKSSNTSVNLLNEIQQHLYQHNELNKGIMQNGYYSFDTVNY